MTWIAEAEVAEVGGEIVVRNQLASRGFGFGIGFNCGPIEAEVRTPTGAAALLTIGAGTIETSGRLGEHRRQHRRRLDPRRGLRGGPRSHWLRRHRRHRRHRDGRRQDRRRQGADRQGRRRCARHHRGRQRPAGRDHRLGAPDHRPRQHRDRTCRRQRSRPSPPPATSTSGAPTAAGCGPRPCPAGSSVGVAEGVAALLDLRTMSGRVRTDLEASGPPAPGEKHVELILSTVSGNVNVERACMSAVAERPGNRDRRQGGVLANCAPRPPLRTLPPAQGSPMTTALPDAVRSSPAPRPVRHGLEAERPDLPHLRVQAADAAAARGRLPGDRRQRRQHDLPDHRRAQRDVRDGRRAQGGRGRRRLSQRQPAGAWPPAPPRPDAGDAASRPSRRMPGWPAAEGRKTSAAPRPSTASSPRSCGR